MKILFLYTAQHEKRTKILPTRYSLSFAPHNFILILFIICDARVCLKTLIPQTNYFGFTQHQAIGN